MRGILIRTKPTVDTVIPLTRIYKNKEYMDIVGDLLEEPMVQDLKLYPHHKHNNRFNHCLEVSYVAFRWAQWLEYDYVACARAGLLHDLFHYEPSTSKNFVTDHYRDHPKIAVLNARQITTLSYHEESMIMTHMWMPVGRFSKMPYIPQSPEAWILTLVDKYCAGKDISYYTGKKYTHLGIYHFLAKNTKTLDNPKTILYTEENEIL